MSTIYFLFGSNLKGAGFNPAQNKQNDCISDRAILYELGLQGKLTTDQLAKKWDNLKRRYKVRQ